MPPTVAVLTTRRRTWREYIASRSRYRMVYRAERRRYNAEYAFHEQIAAVRARDNRTARA